MPLVGGNGAHGSLRADRIPPVHGDATLWPIQSPAAYRREGTGT